MAEIIKLPEFPTFEETEKMKLGIIAPTPMLEEEEEEKEEKKEEPVVPAYVKEENEEEEEETEKKEETGSIIGYVKGLIDLGVLNLPDNFEVKDDFTEDQLRELLDYDAKKRDENSLVSLQSQVKDPKVWEIVDYAIKGGQYADINKFFQIQNTEVSFEKLDVTNEENAKLVILESLKQKGISDKRAKDMLELIIANDELESEATELKKEAIENSKLLKQRELEQAKLNNEKEIARQESWRNDFYKSLKETNFKQEKQSQILSLFNNVRFENGATMPKWNYQLALIQNNPTHFMQFLDLLTMYNQEKGFAVIDKKAEEKKTTEVTDSLFKKLQNHAKGIKLGVGSAAEENQEIFIPQNPADRNVRIK